jgi:hypothetical protein
LIPLGGLGVAARRQQPHHAPKTIGDYTTFEQCSACFDGELVIATNKGVNPFVRGSQVDFVSDFEAILDVPPAQTRRLRQARSRQGDAGRNPRAGCVLWQGPLRKLPPTAVLH